VSSQCKEVGEPQEKKVRTLLVDEEEDEEGLDEEPEEVIFLLSCSLYSVHVFSGWQWMTFKCLPKICFLSTADSQL